MKRRELIVYSVSAFVAGALLSPSGGRGALGRSVRAAEAKLETANAAGKSTHAPRGAEEGDTRLSRVLSALQETSELKRGHDLFLAMRDFSAADIIELMARAEKLPPRYAKQLREALLQQWLDVDPPAAEAWIRAHPADEEAWKFWAEHSPERALAEVHAHPEEKWGGMMIDAAISILAASADHQSRAQAVTALPPDAARDRFLAGELGWWAQEDGAAAFAFAHALPEGPLRTQATRMVLNNIARNDPIEAMRLASSMLPELQEKDGWGTLSLIAREGAAKDRNAAMQWVAALPEAQRLGPSEEIARAWARTDPVAALNWATANGTSPSEEVMRNAMSGGSAETLQWIQALPEGAQREGLLLTALVTNSKFTSAVNASTSVGTVLDSLSGLSSETQLLAARSLGSAWGPPENAERSKAWIAALPDGPLRSAAIESACENLGCAKPRHPAARTAAVS